MELKAYIDLYTEILKPMSIVGRAAHPDHLLHLILIQLLQ